MDLLKEIAEPSRRLLLMELKAGPRNVSELVAATGMKQPNVSNHLSKLRSRGIVRASKVGRQVFYSLASGEVEAALHGLLAQPEDAHGPNLSYEEAARQYAKAAVTGDEVTCTRMIDGLVRNGAPLVRIYQQVLAESMTLIGKWYEVQAVDEGQEHMASAITERMMARVLHFAGPASRSGRKAVLGCIAGNWHSIGIRMISDVLKLSGWKTIYLGGSVPTGSFLTAVREHKPDLVLVSFAHEDGSEEGLELLRQLRAMRAATSDYIVGMGGNLVNSDPQRFVDAGADFTAPNLMVFSEEILPRLDPAQTARLGVFTNHKKLD